MATRELILQKAIEAFAAHGYEGASTAGIARACGVTQPLVHYHFASKENLFRAAVDLLFEGVHHQFGQIDGGLAASAPRELLRDLMRRFVHQCADRPEIAQIVLREATQRNPRFDWMVERHIAPLVVHISGIFAGSLDEGELRAMPPIHLMFVVMGGANLMFAAPGLFEALTGRAPTDPETVSTHADAMVALIERVLLPREAPRGPT